MNPQQSFVALLQACISPVVLISGVGLILLAVSNRLGRTIDKSRVIVERLKELGPAGQTAQVEELRILYKRSRILRASIACIVVSIFCSSLIIPLLLIMNLWPTDLRPGGTVLLMVSVAGILGSAVLLLMDVILTLRALECEVKDHLVENTKS